jgi:hypothetical protein
MFSASISNPDSPDNFGVSTRLQEYRQHVEAVHQAPATHITGTLAELLQDLAEFLQLPDSQIKCVVGHTTRSLP